MAKINQGDQYAVEIVLTDEDNHAVTPSTVDDLKIKMCGIEKSYLAGSLVYRDDKWLFPLTQADTLAMKAGRIPVQAQALIGTTVISTDVIYADIGRSIIRSTF